MMLFVILLLALIFLVLFFFVVRTVIAVAVAILIALVAGLIAEAVVGERRRNPLFSIIVGFVGAVVGTVIARTFNLPLFFTIEGLPIIWTIVGAIIVVFLWQAIRQDRV